jgi:hypothetical protein
MNILDVGTWNPALVEGMSIIPVVFLYQNIAATNGLHPGDMT